MAVILEVKNVIDRPLAEVFDFYARDHVKNHPRWDPDIELEPLSGGPLGVGSVIRRRNSRSGKTVEGTMEVTEFEPNQVLAMVIHDGPLVTYGRSTFEATGAGQTTITTVVDMPWMDEGTDTSFLLRLLGRSAENQKRLMEDEIPLQPRSGGALDD